LVYGNRKADFRRRREFDYNASMKIRFSIRDLLWLTALVAVGIGWYRSSACEQDLRAQVELSSKRIQILEAQGVGFIMGSTGTAVPATPTKRLPKFEVVPSMSERETRPMIDVLRDKEFLSPQR
jgi:hypothetical protein